MNYFEQVFGIGIGTTAILTLFTPMAAKHSLEMLLAVRIIEGVFEVIVTYSICKINVKFSCSTRFEKSQVFEIKTFKKF